MGWTGHTTRVVFENEWMTVREDRVTNPRAVLSEDDQHRYDDRYGRNGE